MHLCTRNPEQLTVREAAERAGLSQSYLRAWVASKKLAADRSTGTILVDADCLALLLRARATRRRPRVKLRLVIDNT
jgi:excisionase family DNA binding protein